MLTVSKLLAPLSNEEIKVVRCLGLNYSDHAVGTFPLELTEFILIFTRPKPTCPNQRMHPSNYLYFLLQTDSPYRFPILFYKPVTTLIGPLATVVIPQVAQPPKDHLPDYEVELVIVIGKAAKDVSEANALDYVLGYTGANDVCIRAFRGKNVFRNTHHIS